MNKDCIPETARRERRRRAFLDAARNLFVERGFDEASLSEVVKRSGGSLSTLYDLFESKQGLLSAVVRDHRIAESDRIDAIIARQGDPAAMLRGLAEEIHNQFLDPVTIGMMRVVMAESLRSPEFAMEVFGEVHLSYIGRLTELFTLWAGQGCAIIPNPLRAANMFMGLLLHDAQMRAFFGERCEEAKIEGRAGAEDAVRLFIAGYAIGGLTAKVDSEGDDASHAG